MSQESRDILAIVGSTDWPDLESLEGARKIIEEILDARPPDEIVSGGAPGIDQLAVQIAIERAIAWREFRPKHRRWQPEGFKERNIQIVAACTRLLVIRSATSRTFGSGWTANLAEQHGKPVQRFMI